MEDEPVAICLAVVVGCGGYAAGALYGIIRYNAVDLYLLVPCFDNREKITRGTERITGTWTEVKTERTGLTIMYPTIPPHP